MSPAATVAVRVLEALGLGEDYERARAVLAHAAARQLPRLSVADIREVLAALPAGSNVYVREPAPDHGPVPRQGARFGGVHEGGELRPEETG